MHYFRSVFTTVLFILYIHYYFISKKTEIENSDFPWDSCEDGTVHVSNTRAHTHIELQSKIRLFLIYKAHKLKYTPTITY